MLTVKAHRERRQVSRELLACTSDKRWAMEAGGLQAACDSEAYMLPKARALIRIAENPMGGPQHRGARADLSNG